jgi:hypothetical protein
LDILGVSFGHLPARVPFSTLAVDTKPETGNEAELLKSLRDSTAFYDLYIAITNRAIDLYAKSGRKKFALRLHGDLAALDMYAIHPAVMVWLPDFHIGIVDVFNKPLKLTRPFRHTTLTISGVH